MVERSSFNAMPSGEDKKIEMNRTGDISSANFGDDFSQIKSDAVFSTEDEETEAEAE